VLLDVPLLPCDEDISQVEWGMNGAKAVAVSTRLCTVSARGRARKRRWSAPGLSITQWRPLPDWQRRKVLGVRRRGADPLDRCRSSWTHGARYGHCTKRDMSPRIGPAHAMASHVRAKMSQEHPGLDHPVPGTARPFLGMARPRLGMTHPLPGMTRPLLGMPHPLHGMTRPLLEVDRPLPGVVRPLDGIRRRLPGHVGPRQGAAHRRQAVAFIVELHRDSMCHADSSNALRTNTVSRANTRNGLALLQSADPL